jgi:putative ABC transport system permease protein
MILENIYNLLYAAILVGLLYSLFTIGLSISFRVLNYPDLTLEGSAIFGGSISYVFLSLGYAPVISLIMGMFAGALSGIFTAVLHVYLSVSKLLSGIITTAILYSINIRLLGNKANVRVNGNGGIFNFINPSDNSIISLIVLVIVLLIVLTFIYILFKIKIGYLLRAMGGNEQFIIRLGYNPKVVIIAGLALSNSIIGLGGAILVHYKNYVDVNMSFGLLIGALASMVLGETLISSRNMLRNSISNIIGTISYNFAIALVLFSWSPIWDQFIHASDVRLISGLMLLVPIAIKKRKENKYKLFKSDW